MVSALCTIVSGCRPPSFSEMPIEPRVTVIRMPRALASSTSMSTASSSPGGNKLWWSAAVVQPDIRSSTSAMRTASFERLGRHPVPYALHRHQPGDEVLALAGRMGAGQRLVEMVVRIDETRQHDMAGSVEQRPAGSRRRPSARDAFDDVRAVDDDPAFGFGREDRERVLDPDAHGGSPMEKRPADGDGTRVCELRNRRERIGFVW